MPFWGGWSDPRVEPKRGFRFVVPFPVYVPKPLSYGTRDNSLTMISKVLTRGLAGPVDPAALNITNRYGADKYFQFLAVSCTKPGFQTEVYKVTPGGATSHPIIRPNQATTYEFSPIKIDLIDTYSHDLASTLTAYLYAYGDINQTLPGSFNQIDGVAQHFTPGKLIPFHNTSTPNEFHIIEFLSAIPPTATKTLEAIAEGGQQVKPEHGTRFMTARRWILKNPYISSVDFGTYSYAQDRELSTVSLEIVYDSYDYDVVTQDTQEAEALADDPSAPISARDRRRLRRQQRRGERAQRREQRQEVRGVRQNLRENWREQGRTPPEISSGLREVRRSQNSQPDPVIPGAGPRRGSG